MADEWSGVFCDVSDDVVLYCNGGPGVSSRCPWPPPPPPSPPAPSPGPSRPGPLAQAGREGDEGTGEAGSECWPAAAAPAPMSHMPNYNIAHQMCSSPTGYLNGSFSHRGSGKFCKMNSRSISIQYSWSHVWMRKKHSFPIANVWLKSLFFGNLLSS